MGDFFQLLQEEKPVLSGFCPTLHGSHDMMGPRCLNGSTFLTIEFSEDNGVVVF